MPVAPAPSDPSSAHPLAPQRALLHPLWMGSLALLALNDQWLKFSGLLPDAVTGKLSDFAGLVIAPALLATALTLRSRRAWSAAHVAVGVVFTAIQLSVPFADLWSSLMAGFGFPWRIASDPTDLLALPMLGLSHHVLGRAMVTAPARLARRSAEAGAAAVGLLCSVATSQPGPEPEPFPEWLPPLQGDVWLHNDTGEEMVIRVRQLGADVLVDCDQIAEDPARLLSDALFGQVQSWTVPTDANITVVDHFEGERLCYAARIDADGFAPAILFWRDGEIGQHAIEGLGLDENNPGWVSLSLDVDDRGHYEARDEVLFLRSNEVSEPTGECAAPDDADRVDWGDDTIGGNFRVAAVTPGVDGCTAIDLEDLATEQDRRLYLCMPTALAFPFVADDRIAIRNDYGIDNTALVFDLLGEDLASAVPSRALWVSHGRSLPQLGALQLAAVPVYGCELSVDACGAVGRAVSLSAGGGAYTSTQVHLGAAPTTLEGSDGSHATIALAHAQDRVAIATGCASGPDLLGYDLELAVLLEGAAP